MLRNNYNCPNKDKINCPTKYLNCRTNWILKIVTLKIPSPIFKNLNKILLKSELNNLKRKFKSQNIKLKNTRQSMNNNQNKSTF